jgi:hypothetical protein
MVEFLLEGAMMTTTSQVLTLQDTAKLLRLSPEVVERQASQGRLPGRKVEGSWRFLLAAIEGWLARRNVQEALPKETAPFEPGQQVRTEMREVRNGVPLLRPQPGARQVTLQDVNQLRDLE